MRWLQDIAKRKYVVLDANAVLRYLLKDIPEQYKIACDVIAQNKCIVYLEVIEEVVFVLLKQYEVSREDIRSSIITLMEDITFDKKDILQIALDEFCNKPKIDFVDCILCGYSKTGRKIFSFDKKLNKRI